MLCESLMLLLVEEGVIAKDRALDAVETVVDVKNELAGTSESVVVSRTSIALLRGVASSISAAPSRKRPAGG